MRPNTSPTSGEKLLTQSDLQNRGWTKCAMTRFAEIPDEIKLNPRYRSASPMKLWRLARIEEIESTTGFQEFIISSQTRRDGAKKAVETKTAQLLAWVHATPVKVPKFSDDNLTQAACRYYNKRRTEIALERGWNFDQPANGHSDLEFLNRICVNFLRHQCSNYEVQLETICGKVGVQKAYREISRKIFAAIAETYPSLAAECERQMSQRLEAS